MIYYSMHFKYIYIYIYILYKHNRLKHTLTLNSPYIIILSVLNMLTHVTWAISYNALRNWKFTCLFSYICCWFVFVLLKYLFVCFMYVLFMFYLFLCLFYLVLFLFYLIYICLYIYSGWPPENRIALTLGPFGGAYDCCWRWPSPPGTASHFRQCRHRWTPFSCQPPPLPRAYAPQHHPF